MTLGRDIDKRISNQGVIFATSDDRKCLNLRGIAATRKEAKALRTNRCRNDRAATLKSERSGVLCGQDAAAIAARRADRIGKLHLFRVHPLMAIDMYSKRNELAGRNSNWENDRWLRIIEFEYIWIGGPENIRLAQLQRVTCRIYKINSRIRGNIAAVPWMSRHKTDMEPAERWLDRRRGICDHFEELGGMVCYAAIRSPFELDTA